MNSRSDRGLASSGPRRVGQGDVVVEGDPELDHRKEEQREDRQNQREFGQRLTLLRTTVDFAANYLGHGKVLS